MDERLYEVEKQKQNALNESNSVYSGLLQDNENLYNEQINNANQQEELQNSILDRQLEYQKEQIEKNKEEARQTYQDEQKRSKNDYLAFNNQYGTNAESLASNGLANSGLSETTKLGSFNTYQNRLATANKAMQDAFTEFDSNLSEAILNNDVQKAQNALSKLQMQSDFLNTFYSNKSTLSQNQLSNNQTLDSDYYGRYQDVISQINYEKEQEEAIREFNEQMAYQREQAAQEQANWEKEYELSKSSLESSSSSSSSKSSGYSSSSSSSSTLTDGSSNYSTQSANGYNIVANPYTGTINSDAQYGVFEYTENGNKTGSGYQPNNVGGSKLSKSSYKVGDIFYNAVGSSGVSLMNQSIWQTNGKYYVWDGSINDYIDVTNDVKTSLSKKVNISW